VKIELLEIAGFAAAIRSMRLPMRSGERSDSESEVVFPGWMRTMGGGQRADYKVNCYIGPKDLALSAHLQSKGPEHGKHLRGIIAWVEITAPLYWWTEAVTYEVGVTKLSSTSSMHTECKSLLGEELEKAKEELGGGYEYTRIWAISYETLSRIYYQRQGHRLPKFQQVREFIESLPLAREMIIDHAPIVQIRRDREELRELRELVAELRRETKEREAKLDRFEKWWDEMSESEQDAAIIEQAEREEGFHGQ